MNQHATHHSPLYQSSRHESAYQHVSGTAVYVDDMPPPARLLHAQVLTSPHALADITSIDSQQAQAMQGVHAVLTAQDILGINDIAPFTHDEPLLADGHVYTTGQAVALVVAESPHLCREAMKTIQVHYQSRLPEAILSVRQAMECDSYHGTPHIMQRGEWEKELQQAPLYFEGEIDTGAQDHFYLETQCALVLPLEQETFHVYSSTQHPSEVQAKVAEVLGIGRHQVVVETKRMGGGFGGKETQGAHYAALAALAAHYTQRPVKIWLNRDQDMSMTGKRHPFYSRYRAGFDTHGMILSVQVLAVSNAGWAGDLSGAILDRCLFHLDNPYYIPCLHFEGRTAKTNLPSNTAFRGFGGPQGAVVIEEIMNQAAEKLKIDPAILKARNFYGPAPRNLTPYHQEVEADRSARIYKQLIQSSEYQQRRDEIDTWNQQHQWLKKGIAYQAVKFGISFTASHLNQAGALVQIYADGSVQLNHGGTEMGQGLHSKMLAICAHELGIPVDGIRVMNTATDKVPNTSATAASSGSDLNGQAVAIACRTLQARLRPVAAELLQCDADEILFRQGHIYAQTQPQNSISFAQVCNQAYMSQISLSATGYYRTPGIFYDRDKGQGHPFHYFAYGACVLEVEVHGLTGEHRVVRIDVLHDVGNSLIPSIDRGQIEGGLVQGLGWLTREELIYAQDGVLKTHSPDTYKIPALGDTPLDFRVHLLDKAEQSSVIHGSKAVGEPPFLLAIGILTALRHAIASYHPQQQVEALPIPCTPEAVLASIEVARGQLEADQALERMRT